MSKVRFLLLCLIVAVLASCGTVKEVKRQNIKTSSNCCMVLVKGGTIMMGTDESNQKEMKVKDFYIGETEVTQALWQEIMGNNPSYFKGNDLPVENVTWDDCQVFVQKLNAKTGKNYRLPTEVEWEYVIRNKNYKSCKFLNDEMLNDIIQCLADNNNKTNESIKTHNVKQGTASEKGVYGMDDNVWEWCNDSDNATRNNMDAENFKIIKGVWMVNGSPETKFIIRYPFHRGSLSSHLGFRLVLDL